jgi:glucose/arabinose dehydrogenase
MQIMQLTHRMISFFVFGAALCYIFFPVSNFGSGQPIINNPNIWVETVIEGLEFPTSMAFLGRDDILVLEKEKGTVQRIVNGEMLEKPLLDVNVATKSERGMLGIAVDKNQTNTYVFLYYTESGEEDGDDESNGIDPLGNRLYRYELVNNELVRPTLLLDIPAVPGHFHQGGAVTIGPDRNIYLSTGDVDHNTKAQNIEGVEPDGTGGILRVTQNGQVVNGNGILGDEYPLNTYYAYGIRNSFGIDFDPVTGNLWDTENGPWYGDEINLVEPEFNSGWKKVQGIWKPNGEERGDLELNPDLVDFNGKGKYSEPEFIWNNSVGPSAVKFLDSDAFGQKYKNDLLVGNVNEQALYRFELNEQRTELDLEGPVADKIAVGAEDVKRYKLAEGLGRITDIEIGPDGYLYIVSHTWDRESDQIDGTILRLIPTNSTSQI